MRKNRFQILFVISLLITAVQVQAQDKVMQVHSGGEGEVSISANELSAGVYFYTLVVDGQIVNSRQMVVGN